MTQVPGLSATYHTKYPPSTDLFTCEHGVGYPDACKECNKRMVTIVVGGQYGSEAKGKCVVHLAQKHGCALAIRTGGPNAGHTVYINGQKYVTRQLPSALAVPGVQLAIGAGGMVDVNLLWKEISQLSDLGVNIASRLWIDPFAAIVDPDAGAIERDTMGLGNRLGSTQTGTGLTQSQRILRVARVAHQVPELRNFLWDVAQAANIKADAGQRVIIEGTQGFGLSMLHGQCYPFCTSRDTSASGFASEVGISPRLVQKIFMVIRTWPIRVGGNSGPMYSEVDWETVRTHAGYPSEITEMTSVTKKVRRVGWFDPTLMRRALMINRPTDICVAGMDYVNFEDKDKKEWDDLSDMSKSWVRGLMQTYNCRVSQLYTGPAQESLIDLVDKYGIWRNIISDPQEECEGHE